MNATIELTVNNKNKATKEVKATVWEKYGKRRVYFVETWNGRELDRLGEYDLVAKKWTSIYLDIDSNKGVLESAFASILEIAPKSDAWLDFMMYN